MIALAPLSTLNDSHLMSFHDPNNLIHCKLWRQLLKQLNKLYHVDAQEKEQFLEGTEAEDTKLRTLSASGGDDCVQSLNLAKSVKIKPQAIRRSHPHDLGDPMARIGRNLGTPPALTGLVLQKVATQRGAQVICTAQDWRSRPSN
jgi:hypothetical protein